MTYPNGDTIRRLREKRGFTQRELAEQLDVSDKTVSKWETGKGLPDISLIEPLSEALQVSVSELFSGEPVENRNQGGNLMRGNFHICPLCGNVIYAMGDAMVSCCGIRLFPLRAEEEESHVIRTEIIDNELYVSLDHPMSKSHYISFLAMVNADRLQLVKLYPEQDAAARFVKRGHGYLFAYCNHHGLFRLRF